jgi:hypothetical protein
MVPIRDGDAVRAPAGAIVAVAGKPVVGGDPHEAGAAPAVDTLEFKMNARNDVVVRNSLRAVDCGYAIDVLPRTPRTIRLADFETIRVALDGIWASPDATLVSFEPGVALPVSSIDGTTEQVWETGHSATLYVSGAPRPVPGTDHRVMVELVYDAPDAQASADRWVTIETAA